MKFLTPTLSKLLLLFVLLIIMGILIIWVTNYFGLPFDFFSVSLFPQSNCAPCPQGVFCSLCARQIHFTLVMLVVLFAIASPFLYVLSCVFVYLRRTVKTNKKQYAFTDFLFEQSWGRYPYVKRWHLFIIPFLFVMLSGFSLSFLSVWFILGLLIFLSLYVFYLRKQAMGKKTKNSIFWLDIFFLFLLILLLILEGGFSAIDLFTNNHPMRLR